MKRIPVPVLEFIPALALIAIVFWPTVVLLWPWVLWLTAPVGVYGFACIFWRTQGGQSPYYLPVPWPEKKKQADD
jgi:hypothetical protein